MAAKPKVIKFKKVLIHTKEDGETHYVKTVNGMRAEKTLCGNRLHSISTVYTPKLQVVCGECRERVEAFSFNLKGIAVPNI